MSSRPHRAVPSPRRAARAVPPPQKPAPGRAQARPGWERGKRICVGRIGAARGVAGEVRLRSFTADPQAIASYGPVETEDGRVFQIESLRPVKDHFVARLSGINDREAARALANTRLYVPRDRLPEPEEPDEFYHDDLIGLAVVDPAGNAIGTLVGIYNFGAGDLIEVRPHGGGTTQLLPFNEATVPSVDIAAGRIVVVAPDDWFSSAPPKGTR